jgi:deferrochelatase/peroxidase EfeB
MTANEFTAIVNIKQGCKSAVEAVLKEVGNPLKVDNPYLQFAAGGERQTAYRTHFARMVVIPGKDEDTIYPGEEPILIPGQLPPPEGQYRLVCSAIFDGDARSFIRDVVSYSPQLNRIWELCDGYDDATDLYTYLQQHRVHPQVFYNTFLHETVDSITKRAEFRKDVQTRLDMVDRAGAHTLEAAVDAISGLKPFQSPPKEDLARPALLTLITGIVMLVAVIGVILWLLNMVHPIAALIGFMLIIGLLALVLRRLIPLLSMLIPSWPKQDDSSIGIYGAVKDQVKASDEPEMYQTSMLTGREDVIVQNQFTLYLTFEGNWLVRHIRLLRILVLTLVVQRTLRITDYPGSLGGLTTVHFGHWMVIDGGRRLLFMTNYDGSWENYIADFVNKIHVLLDVQLACFESFDEEGTRNITAFRRWLRRVQPQSSVFYSGYPHSTVRTISRDIHINDTFPSNWNDTKAVEAWLKLFGDPAFSSPDTDEKKAKEEREEYLNRKVPDLPPHHQLTASEWSDIQSIIVYGYANLPHGRYLFLHIDDAVKARDWIKSLIPMLTTVEKWEADDPARQLRTAVNVAFTYPAMKILELPDETLKSFSREYREGIAPPPKNPNTDELHPRSINLGDVDTSAPQHWGVGHPSQKDSASEIHIMLLLNGVTSAEVDVLQETAPFNQIGQPSSGISLVMVEQGTTPVTGREPFGFRDGVSNPWIEGTRYSVRNRDGSKNEPLKLTDTEILKHDADMDRHITMAHDPVVRSGEFILGYPNEYGQLPATPMMPADSDKANQLQPVATEGDLKRYRDFGRNGSYLVYRKLTQNVESFWDYMRQQAQDDPVGTLHLAAKMVGRWPSGTPLVMSPHHDDTFLSQQKSNQRNNSLYNDFRFRMGDDCDDRDGMRCPFGSHIRRSHPRDSLIDDSAWESMRNTNLHRIMRRSAAFGRLPDHVVEGDYYARNAQIEITYQDRPEHPADRDGVGIHFLGINANIQQQFEFIQQAWSNNRHFNGMFESKDPLTGNHEEPQPKQERLEEKNAEKFAEQSVDAERLHTDTMTIPAAPYRQRLTGMSRFVNVRGGAYLFIPSLRALTYMSSTR